MNRITPLTLSLVLALTLILCSCGRVKRKGQELANKAEQKVESVSKDVVDKILPHFDAYEADTEFNKKRFAEFIQVEQTPDVKNIYCFDDAIGIDTDYQFSFSCDISTVRRILNKHEISIDTTTTDYAFGLQHSFDWWDKDKIAKLPLYSYKGDRYYKYFWHDVHTRKAYFFCFDM